MAKKKNGNNELVKRALELNELGLTNAAIGRDLGVTGNTVRRWFRELGMPPKRKGPVAANRVRKEKAKAAKKEAAEKAKQEAEDKEADSDEIGEMLEDGLKAQTIAANREEKLMASLQEDKELAELAEAQTSPADQYQMYMAMQGIKLIRDNIRHIKGPRTIRDVDMLDQLVRRSMGLNAKGGSSNSKMTIDISILNNSKADKGDGSLKKSKKTIDAEFVDE